MFFILNPISSKDIFKIFWNKYLIQTSILDRSNKLSKKTYNFHLIKVIIRFILRDTYSLISLLSFFISYIFIRKIKLKKKTIFLFTHNSQLNENYDNFQKYRVNLYPFISIRNSSKHIFKILNFNQILYLLVITIINFPKIYFDLLKICKKRKINFLAYIIFNNLNFTSILELNLLFKCLTKIDRNITIATSSQFCPYLQLLSIYKISNRNNVWKLHLFQHGVYELDRFRRPYSKIYADKIFLKFKHSLDWVKSNYIYNKNLAYSFVFYKNNILYDFNSTKNNLVIAYASSGFYERDFLILQTIYSLQNNKKNIDLIFYPHPALKFNQNHNIFKSFKKLMIVNKERFKNTDLLITGYSSLGLEYLNLNLKVLFIPFDDEICAFKDKSLIVLRNESLLFEKLNEILNLL